jgi:hypothetical protein
VRKAVKFLVCVWPHGDVWESISEAHRDDITNNCSDTGHPSIDFGTIIHFILVVFHLSGRVDRLARRHVCILVEYGNHRSLVGLGDSTGSDNENVGNLMVVGTFDVYNVSSCFDDPKVTASIRSPVYQVCIGLVPVCFRDAVSHIDHTISFTIEFNLSLFFGVALLGKTL